jgi:hypothetical protein
VHPTLDELENLLRDNPDAEPVLGELVSAYYSPALIGCERRVELIVEYVRRFPRNIIAQCPFAHVDPVGSPAAFTRIESEWQRHSAESPNDDEIVCGHALFIAVRDRNTSISMLESALLRSPSNPRLWTELGRLHPEPRERLRFLQEAKRHGSEQPNLLVWIARAAVDADDLAAAEGVGMELLALVQAAREKYGAQLDWTEDGRDLWNRARSASGDDAAAGRLVSAITDHAYRKHWGHTTVGLVALRRGARSAAVDHLRHSGAVVGDYRLSSYGPAFTLARALCDVGEWSAVENYLVACAPFWDPELLRKLTEDVRERKVPDFPVP